MSHEDFMGKTIACFRSSCVVDGVLETECNVLFDIVQRFILLERIDQI